MAHKTPLASVDASHFVQIPSMETLDWGLLFVKLPPIHLQNNLTYGRRLMPEISRPEMVVWIVLKVIVQNVAFIFCYFVILKWHLKMVL